MEHNNRRLYFTEAPVLYIKHNAKTCHTTRKMSVYRRDCIPDLTKETQNKITNCVCSLYEHIL